jgi:transcriptional regulator with XRE-family HTH domain
MNKKSGAEEIGKRISARRNQRALSQGTVGRRAGLDASYLCRIETGKVAPTVRTALRIADALHCTLDDLVGPTPPHRKNLPCPVNPSGSCLMDSVDMHGKRPTGRAVSARQIRVMRQFSELLLHADTGMVNALEALIREIRKSRTPG